MEHSKHFESHCSKYKISEHERLHLTLMKSRELGLREDSKLIERRQRNTRSRKVH